MSKFKIKFINYFNVLMIIKNSIEKSNGSKNLRLINSFSAIFGSS